MAYKELSIYIDQEGNYILVPIGYTQKPYTRELSRFVVLSSNSSCEEIVKSVLAVMDEFGEEQANPRAQGAIQIYRKERSYRKATEGVVTISIRYTDDEGYILHPWTRNAKYGGYDGMPESNIYIGHSPTTREFYDAMQQAIALSS